VAVLGLVFREEVEDLVVEVEKEVLVEERVHLGKDLLEEVVPLLEVVVEVDLVLQEFLVPQTVMEDLVHQMQ
jgi:hypothetical protein